MAHHVHDQQPFGGSSWFVFVVQVVHQADEFPGVLRRKDAEGSVKAMTEIVQRGDGFAFPGARTGRRLGVGAISVELGLGEGSSRLRILRGGRIGGCGFGGLVGQFAFFMFFARRI